MIPRTWIAACALACFTASSWASSETNDLDARVAAIEKDLEAARQRLGVPGAALVIVKDDRVILKRGFGLRDVERDLPVTPDTLFAIGSCTKGFTAMAAVIAADEGKLSLEDSPKRYLPYFKLKDPQADSQVTVRDLLSHRSGLGRFDVAWLSGALTREETIKVTGLATPTARLREKFQYQNIMYSATGEVTGAAYRSSWEAVIAKRLFEPLGMTSSNTAVKAMRQATDFAWSYHLEKNVASKTPLRDLTNIAPAGAINSNVTDMAQWLRLMLNGGVLDGRRLVSERGFKELLTPHIPSGAGTAYGLGWALSAWHGHRVASHAGGIDGFSALVSFMPEQGLGFVMLTNALGPLTVIAQEAIWTHLIGKPEGAPKPAPQPLPAQAQQADTTNTAAPLDITIDELMAKVIETAGWGPEVQAKAAEIVEATAQILTSRGTQGIDRLAALVEKYRTEPWLKDLEGGYTGKIVRYALHYSEAELRKLAAEYDWENDAPWNYNALATLRRLRTPLLWLIAGDDTEGPGPETADNLLRLKREGLPVTIVTFPHTEHGLKEYTLSPEGQRIPTRHAEGSLTIELDFARHGALRGPYGNAQVL